MTDIKKIISDKLDSAAFKGVEVKTSKYGMYALTNSASSGRGLRAYFLAAMVEVGVLTEAGKRTGRAGDTAKFKAICTPATKALQYHGEKTGKLLLLRGTESVSRATAATHFRISSEAIEEFERDFQRYADSIKQFRHFMHTGEAGKDMDYAKGTTTAAKRAV
jgi:hypothetical protein